MGKGEGVGPLCGASPYKTLLTPPPPLLPLSAGYSMEIKLM